jgi:hypothetical protein
VDIWYTESGIIPTSLLPLGRRFSVDSLIGSLRDHSESRVEQLERREFRQWLCRPVVSLAVLGLLLQFAVIYLFNVLHKTGSAWKDGSAVHYALCDDRMVTAAGVWAREFLPYPVLQQLTWGTLWIEAAAVVLILTPVFSRPLRMLAVVLLSALHLGFGLFLQLGAFSYVMMSFFPILIPGAYWDRWEVWRRRRGPRLRVSIDPSDRAAFQFARIIARLDGADRIGWGTGQALARVKSGDSVLVDDLVSGLSYSGSAAEIQMIRALPFGRVASWALKVPGVLPLVRCSFDGLVRLSPPLWPTLRKLRFPVFGLREAAVIMLMIACLGDLSRSNPAWPARWHFKQPKIFHAIVWYPRIHQYWRMFSPDPSRTVVAIAVEAKTRSGRVVDPYNEVASRFPSLPSPDGNNTFPNNWGQSYFFTAFTNRIDDQRFAWMRPWLKKWLVRYHLRTGDPADQIIDSTVYRVRSSKPAPGTTTKGAMTRSVLPGYVRQK